MRRLRLASWIVASIFGLIGCCVSPEAPFEEKPIETDREFWALNTGDTLRFIRTDTPTRDTVRLVVNRTDTLRKAAEWNKCYPSAFGFSLEQLASGTDSLLNAYQAFYYRYGDERTFSVSFNRRIAVDVPLTPGADTVTVGGQLLTDVHRLAPDVSSIPAPRLEIVWLRLPEGPLKLQFTNGTQMERVLTD
jgi:hypothetical protein